MFDVERFFRDYRISYKRDSEKFFAIRCAFCGDSSQHMGWSVDGYVNCWKCGGHSLLYSIQKLLNVSRKSAEEIQHEYDGISRHLKATGKIRAKSLKLPGTALGKYHRRYLKKRGFDPDTMIKKYGLLGTGPNEEWEGMDYELRIIIPIRDISGKIVSFQGRDITGRTKLRYKGCPKEKSVVYYKDILYNAENATPHAVGVLEGVTDVWRMGNGFVATFGTSITDSQVRELSRYERVIFMFDPEREAQERARKAAVRISSLGRTVELVELKAGRDPGELDEEEAHRIRKYFKI